MPDQPEDPIHYDMKIPPEPKKQDAEDHESAKKQGDKINTGTGTAGADTPSGEKKGGA